MSKKYRSDALPQDETYIDQAIRETEESIRDAERELGRLRRQLAWLIQHRPKPDDGQLSLGDRARLEELGEITSEGANRKPLRGRKPVFASWRGAKATARAFPG